MVEQVLADDGSAGAVEIHRSDVAGIVRDEEIAIDRRQHAQQHRTWDAERVGQGKHGNDNSTLTVDEHADGEEREGDGPGYRETISERPASISGR